MTNLDPDSPENWVHIKNLEPGTYNFRVVAVNGRGEHLYETRSEPKKIVIGENIGKSLNSRIKDLCCICL